MLDQNSDRMWYVIGALVVGAGIILLANKAMPELFSDVTDTFNKQTDSIVASLNGIDVFNISSKDSTKESVSSEYSNSDKYTEDLVAYIKNKYSDLIIEDNILNFSFKVGFQNATKDNDIYGSHLYETQHKYNKDIGNWLDSVTKNESYSQSIPLEEFEEQRNQEASIMKEYLNISDIKMNYGVRQYTVEIRYDFKKDNRWYGKKIELFDIDDSSMYNREFSLALARKDYMKLKERSEQQTAYHGLDVNEDYINILGKEYYSVESTSPILQ